MIQNGSFDDFFGLPNGKRSYYDKLGNFHFINHDASEGFMAPGYAAHDFIVPPPIMYKADRAKSDRFVLYGSILIAILLFYLAYLIYDSWKMIQEEKKIQSSK